ncbi:hypothetical protein SVIOM342S_03061 [Streptomyces violaceorubidus]
MTILVFGVGTDYALLLVSRYREELRRIERPYDAMLAALRGCGPAVLASSGTVAAGLLSCSPPTSTPAAAWVRSAPSACCARWPPC